MVEPCSYFSSMKKARITEAKHRLSGSPVMIPDESGPVARLEPVTTCCEPEDSRLSRLVREGVLRSGRTPLPRTLFAGRLPRAKRGSSAVRALLSERREGR
jgi:hypothetical protein